MAKRTSLWIIALQTLVIIGLFWVLVFYGRDEYEAMQQADEEEVEGRSRLETSDGLNWVKLNQATQLNSGITVQALQAYQYQGNIKALGTVISLQPLIDYNSQYQQLKAQLALAESALPNHLLQLKRLQVLNADDKNVSDKVVQEAQALVLNDQTQISTSKAQLNALTATIAAQWGPVLTRLVTANQTSDELHDLLTQKRVLIQVSFPISYREPDTQSTLNVTPIHEQNQPITAHYMSQSIQSDISNIGKTFFYSAPAEYLRVGMRVNAVPNEPLSSETQGVSIPNQAIVWHAGLAWVYLKKESDRFLRRPVSVEHEIDGGWFDPSLSPGTQVVTRGAQLLLSEEFKYQIKNENED